MPDKDLQELVASWLDGRLNSEDSKKLQEELRASTAARVLFRKYAHLDAALHEIADLGTTSGASQPNTPPPVQLPGVFQRSSSEHVTDAGSEELRVTLPATRASPRGPTAFGAGLGWYAAIAFGTLFVVSTYVVDRTAERGEAPVAQVENPEELTGKGDVRDGMRPALLRMPPAPVATVSLANGVKWAGAQLKVGEAISEGETIGLQEGSIRISVGFGAEIIADAPLSLTFLSSNRVALHHGEVAVDVAPWAKGFTVETHDMNIVDLGTTFTVSAMRGGKTEASVLKGVIRVQSSKAGSEQLRGLLISEGEQVSIGDSGSFEREIRKGIGSLQDSLDFGTTKRYRPVALYNTGLGLATGDEDLHWKVVAGPEGSFDGPQYASVCVPHEAYLRNDPQQSQWVSIVNWQTAKATSTYTFQTEFSLEDYDVSTIQLFGRFLADNGVSAVRVNGQAVQVKSWVDNVKYQPFRDPQFRFVNVTEGLVQGRNVIEIDVRNGMQRTWIENERVAKLRPIPNPMALRVEWYAFGRHPGFAKVEDNAKRMGSMDRRLVSSFDTLSQSAVSSRLPL